MVDGLERSLAGRATVAHVDINDDSGEALAKKYAIRGVPAFLLLDAHGELVYRKLGGRPDVREIERLVATE